MLYQPTNIVPSSFAGEGGDILDRNENVAGFSWQVNGPSAMTAYRLDFYSTEPSHTLLYSTGKVVLDEPFYGMTGNGQPQTFSCEIPWETLLQYLSADHVEYTYKITEFWMEGSPATENSVVQSTENLFHIGEQTFVTLTAPLVIDGPIITVRGAGTHDYEWVRWVVFTYPEVEPSHLSEPVGDILFDTGRISTGNAEFTYDGFLEGEFYYIGVQAKERGDIPGWSFFSAKAEWNTARARATATATLANGCMDVLIDIPFYTYAIYTGAVIPGRTDWQGGLPVPAGDPGLSWRLTNGFGANSFCSLAWCGEPEGPVTIDFRAGGVYGDDWITLTLNMDGSVDWDASTNYAKSATSGTLTTVESVEEKVVTILADAEKVYVVIYTPEKSTYSAEGAYLNEQGYIVLPFAPGTVEDGYIVLDGMEHTKTPSSVNVYEFDSPFRGGFGGYQISIPSDSVDFSVSGDQVCYYTGIIVNKIQDDLLSQLLTGAVRNPTFNDQWFYLTDFANNNYRAFGVFDGVDPSAGMTLEVYRKEQGQKALVPIYRGAPWNLSYYDEYSSRQRLLDCGTENGKTYTYVLFFTSESESGTYTTGTMEVNEVTPCGWNWVLTTAAADENGWRHMTGQYVFGLNVATEAISNNNSPSILQNFTRYPTRQRVTANYRTGTLTAYIGNVDQTANVYVDTAAQAEAIMALSNSADDKYLRTRKGERWKVETSSPVQMQVGDNYAEQPYSATLAWVETGNASKEPVVCLPYDEAWPL